MGISWSNRRRNNNYLHHPPPSHQFIPSSYLYTSEPPSLPPSSHPPPQQQNYIYPSNPPYAPLPPHPPHNLYPTHPPPPPPPPNYPSYYYSHGYNSCNYANPMMGQSNYPPYAPLPPHPPHNLYPTHPPPPPNYPSYFYSHGYNSCNYANPMMGQSNYPPYYANQINGWSASPAVVPAQLPPLIPAPYVEHQNAKKVRNDVNVHKDTLRVEVDEQNPDQHLVSFVFDALFDGSITLYYFAKEESECKFVPLFPEAYMPVRIPFQKGLGQKFRQPSGTGIDLGFLELNDLSKPSPGEDVFPLVIAAEACSLPGPTTDDQSGDSVPNTSANKQITQAVLEKNNGDPFQVRVIRQILCVDGVRYELREIYGIGSSTTQDFNDSDPSKECIICMTEHKDTAVLPCRHMCMCSECAKELRLRSDKCPICRHPIEELIEIKINSCEL